LQNTESQQLVNMLDQLKLRIWVLDLYRVMHGARYRAPCRIVVSLQL